jgi:serine protease Do
MTAVALSLGLAGTMAVGLGVGNTRFAFHQEPPVTSEATVVKVLVGEGHGSGVNIGEGKILTAAHVVGDGKTAKIKTSDGKELDASVVWSNKDYDVAMLQSDPLTLGRGSALDCREPVVGELIQSAGNPIMLEFVSSFGRVAGGIREEGPWKTVFITNLTTAPGQSGGPVFDKNSNVIGIAVGVIIAPLGGHPASPDGKQPEEVPTPTITGFGTAVPSSAVCKLLAGVTA